MCIKFAPSFHHKSATLALSMVLYLVLKCLCCSLKSSLITPLETRLESAVPAPIYWFCQFNAFFNVIKTIPELKCNIVYLGIWIGV